MIEIGLAYGSSALAIGEALAASPHAQHLVIVDDCDWPSVAMAVSYFSTNAGWSEHPSGRPPRLRAFRLPDPRMEPRFEEFEPFGIETR